MVGRSHGKLGRALNQFSVAATSHSTLRSDKMRSDEMRDTNAPLHVADHIFRSKEIVDIRFRPRCGGAPCRINF